MTKDRRALQTSPDVAKAVILVVDDEPLIRLTIADTLNDFDMDVLEAASADDAITTLEGRSDVAALITDVRMPGRMDGLELATRVADRWPNIRVTVMSGHAHVQGELPAGTDFIPKPFSTSALVRHLRERLA